MENKWSVVVMMMFVLVVMAPIGEAINHICVFKCELTCRDPEFKTECFRQCMKDCEHRPSSNFHSTSHSQMKTREMEEMRG
ncbi:hypothetical protein EUTSA_v10005221mg [Eutrema salsugineum]|uniref:Plant thionin family protein n=1 Tax=Eutrema salsugineum TaxID=72664 RepID=V4KNU1_EUTSA|nr:uncharacterized protein LOC18012136 [Eutrema salsugineum]ESQ31607.1 hypothetical protein EUTSA_v10005221mg [Eutrema salsugineum]